MRTVHSGPVNATPSHIRNPSYKSRGKNKEGRIASPYKRRNALRMLTSKCESSLLNREQSRCRTDRTHRYDHRQVAIGRSGWNLHVDLVHACGARDHACETHRRRRSADRDLRKRGQRERVRRHHSRDQSGVVTPRPVQ